MRSARSRLTTIILVGAFGHSLGNVLRHRNLSSCETVGYDSNMQFILNLMLAIPSTLTSTAFVRNVSTVLSGSQSRRYFGAQLVSRPSARWTTLGFAFSNGIGSTLCVWPFSAIVHPLLS